jgi:hypothetical protein
MYLPFAESSEERNRQSKRSMDLRKRILLVNLTAAGKRGGERPTAMELRAENGSGAERGIYPAGMSALQKRARKFRALFPNQHSCGLKSALLNSRCKPLNFNLV